MGTVPRVRGMGTSFPVMPLELTRRFGCKRCTIHIFPEVWNRFRLDERQTLIHLEGSFRRPTRGMLMGGVQNATAVRRSFIGEDREGDEGLHTRSCSRIEA
jgi:hypothetical protein